MEVTSFFNESYQKIFIALIIIGILIFILICELIHAIFQINKNVQNIEKKVDVIVRELNAIYDKIPNDKTDSNNLNITTYNN